MRAIFVPDFRFRLSRAVGGILVLQLEVIAPSEVSSFPFKASDVTRIMDLQASNR